MRGSKGQSVQGSKGLSGRGQTRIAREEPVNVDPLKRVRRAAGKHEPAVVVVAPVRAHQARNAVLINHLEKVRVAVCEERPRITLRSVGLPLKHGEKLTRSGFGYESIPLNTTGF